MVKPIGFVPVPQKAPKRKAKNTKSPEKQNQAFPGDPNTNTKKVETGVFLEGEIPSQKVAVGSLGFVCFIFFVGGESFYVFLFLF